VAVVQTLGARLSSRDAARFVGRSDELARLESLLSENAAANVVLLHGPAGVGKSALMRELGRRAAARGWSRHPFDARDLTPVADALEETLAPALAEARPILLLDSWDRMAALDSYLRSDLLPRLSPDALVVLATRRRPAAGWFTAGWEHIVLDMRIGPMSASDADVLLAARGVETSDGRAAAVEWARGSPLALVLAADAGQVPTGQAADDDPPGIVDRLLPRLLDAQPDGEQRSVLAVAAMAHVTTPELLAAVLPDVDSERAFDWLSDHPSAEPLRDGVMLHDLVGRALRSELRRRSPELERDLRRRLVDALYARATRDGFLPFTRDLQHLVQHPAIRWGFAWDASGRYRIDSPRSGDLDAIAARCGQTAREWLQSARPYFLEAPDRVTVVRDQDDVLAGYGISVTQANAPARGRRDPVLGPRIEHATARFPGGAVICRQAVDLTRKRSSPVTALIGMAAMIGSGLRNPAAAYLPIARGDAAGQAFSAACGAVAVPELAIQHAGVWVECHVLDYGPGGLLAAQRAEIYRELGLSVPPPRTPPTLEVVRDALRQFGSPALLAAGPLAPRSGSPAARAESVRALIDQAVRDAFGPSAEDQQLRRVLTRGYLDPAPTHELAAAELNLSRTAYFRRLRTAVERVAAYLAGPEDPSARPD
jgi:hypothetical protein